MKTLISTVFKGDVVKMATYRLSPDRLILFDSKEYKHTDVSDKGVEDFKRAWRVTVQ